MDASDQLEVNRIKHHRVTATEQLDVDVTGAQVLGLIVGDAGDGDGNDHGDWAVPTLTCT